MLQSEVLSIVDKHIDNNSGLMSILEEIQEKYRYLPEFALKIVSQRTKHSLSEIYGVATFYKAFSLHPRGKHLISVCLGTACHVRGGHSIAYEFSKQLDIKPGCTTSDKEFSLETVNCLGACALGPIVVVDGQYYSKVLSKKVKQIIKETSEGLDNTIVTTDRRIFPVNVNCPYCNHTLMNNERLIDTSPTIRLTITWGVKHGSLYLSSLYGSYNSETDFEIPEGAVVNLFCPHCHSELRGISACPECDMKMISFKVRGGGILQICPKKGCSGHRLDLSLN